MNRKNYLNAATLYRLYSKTSVAKLPLISRILEMCNYLVFNCSVPYTCKIGRGTFFSHRGMAVVIHKQAVIGEDCVIGTCVTIGGKGKGIEGAPVIGNNCYIATGAKILGPIKIGNNVTVGANSVVVNDVDEGQTVVGIPAKVLEL